MNCFEVVFRSIVDVFRRIEADFDVEFMAFITVSRLYLGLF